LLEINAKKNNKFEAIPTQEKPNKRRAKCFGKLQEKTDSDEQEAQAREMQWNLLKHIICVDRKNKHVLRLGYSCIDAAIRLDCIQYNSYYYNHSNNNNSNRFNDHAKI
jgi:hypothetical protein